MHGIIFTVCFSGSELNNELVQIITLTFYPYQFKGDSDLRRIVAGFLIYRIMNNRKNPIKEILTNAEFNSGEKLLMIALLFDQEDMNIWTNKAIGERIGVLGNSVSKYLKRLESLGYIRISYYKEQGHLFRNIQIINY